MTFCGVRQQAPMAGTFGFAGGFGCDVSQRDQGLASRRQKRQAHARGDMPMTWDTQQHLKILLLFA